MNSITARILLTDEQIEAQFAHLGVDLGIGYGGEDDITITNDSIDDFLAARAGWTSKGEVVRNSGGALVVEGVQANKSLPRRTLYVIDFGNVRLAYGL